MALWLEYDEKIDGPMPKEIQIGQYLFKYNPAPAAIIDIEAPTLILGNDFEETHPGANGAVWVDNSTCVIVGNRFPFAPTSGPPLKDDQGSNYYFANSRLFNSGTGGQVLPTGVGIAPGSQTTIEGMRDWSGTGSVGGTATNSIIIEYRNPFGLAQTRGYFENTGANSITVTEEYTTQNQGVVTRTTAVGAGVKINLDPFDITGLSGTIDYQVVKYVVKVSGTTISWHKYFQAPCGVYTN